MHPFFAALLFTAFFGSVIFLVARYELRQTHR